MNTSYLLVLLVLTFGSLINSIKWARFAQREHYLGGSVTKFYFRWVKSRTSNYLFYIALLISGVVSLWLYYFPIIVVVLTLITPFGLSFSARTSKVENTERLLRVNKVYYFIIISISAVSLVVELGYLLALLANMFSYFVYDQCLKILYNYEKSLTQHFVDDASSKLKKLQIPIVAITGSYSKTTTKNVLHQILSTQNSVFPTKESFNNRLGIAKAINEDLKDSNELAIIEMGTYGIGEIREICSWVRPHIAVITGIAPVHLERMKSLENILDAKSEIVELAGSVVINGDDELLLNQARLWTNQKLVFDCSITSNQAMVFVDFQNGTHSIFVKGKKLLTVDAPELLQLSIALSTGVLLALDLNVSEYFSKITSLDKTSHRQSVITSDLGHKIIDNSFNSNPMAIEHSLKLFSDESTTDSKKYLVTPGMIELGNDQFSLNYAFGVESSKVIDQALVIGHTNKNSLLLAFQENNIPAYWFPNRTEAVNYLNTIIKKEDVVLFENDLPDHYP
ncbi:Mur ligase family protein [Candidatus Actinomarina sp.]|nr:Mur ligase family protein [Candidatus Actinomarina sp.]